ncbi:hypothetical protein [Alcanivorax sp. 1008]|uniref:hypothetical protein n=1 Tax=Alcanivorax sp. 1008 TaxID=2816853 RepID=UPI001D471EB4|nr:hypothetical protein [Alcanivorax sp. 1008]MCC1496820.1 hypothetical protein [Alcanivorax sp. 1008]
MMRRIATVLLVTSSFLAAAAVQAQDVYVDGYYRSDGTYVRPHVRSAPDSSRSNNYGPSQNSQQLMNPYQRDYDRDGTPNYLDNDSDNDGYNDNNDRNPYSWD